MKVSQKKTSVFSSPKITAGRKAMVISLQGDCQRELHGNLPSLLKTVDSIDK
jgi:hypothetical protein